MEGLELLEKKTIQPLSYFGLKHSFFDVNYTTVVHTWIIIGIMLLCLIPIYWVIKKRSGLTHFIVTSFVNYFVQLTKQSLGIFSIPHFTFITSIFMFIFLCNSVPLVPWIEEPTQDLNTTLSLGIISFLYIQFYSIKTNGLWNYTKEYFSPFFLMLPLNVIGKIASIVSLSFRLFGNIFGGVIIAKIFTSAIDGQWLYEILGIPLGIVITLFFGLFEGALQAFVFTMLTITYLATALQSKQTNNPEGTTC